MSSLVIRLDPSLLPEPDADLRYLIPDLLKDILGEAARDEGYDYEDKTYAMLIFIGTADIEMTARVVIQLIDGNLPGADHLPSGRHLAQGATVGISAEDPATASEFEIIFPSHLQGQILRVRS